MTKRDKQMIRIGFITSLIKRGELTQKAAGIATMVENFCIKSMIKIGIFRDQLPMRAGVN